ncbi:amidohydrolase family protein [Paractinoplanes rishiriensis]|uniref:Amidohydrolase n=1 Tax=Paractinoplanes rishiriensis TaxID=1050105 RepID=A0A919MT42_9ACTN|nr:amidohydrolase family protein [Actinoplanes rishiriensis]GIE98871.1 amidohydrolase [Actinoplanes rishiriensis]
MRLIDHHCHGAVTGPLDRAAFEALLTESDRPPPPGCSGFDSQLGFAVRRWCAPVLGLEAHCDPGDYLDRRAELGPDEVNRRLLRAAEVEVFLVDSGYRAGELLDGPAMAAAAAAEVREIVRLEAVAEALDGVSAAGFADAFDRVLDDAAAGAAGFKSVVAYRQGLDFDPHPPTRREVTRAAGRWLRRGRPRLDDPVLLRHLIWTAVDRGGPVQFHTGFGDPDLDLARGDPLLMTSFLRATRDRGAAVLLLHCYPFHRQAGYLAQAFPHVYLDVGLALNHVGARAPAVLAESLELAPFHKVLYSSDAFGPAELHHLGAVLFRQAFGEVAGQWSKGDAERVAELIGSGNARRVYRL